MLSTNLLFALSKLCTPIKSILNLQHTCGDQSTFNLLRSCVQFRILLVEVGGFAPPSRTYFSLLHTAIILFITSQHKKSSMFFGIIVDANVFDTIYIDKFPKRIRFVHDNLYYITFLRILQAVVVSILQASTLYHRHV